MLVTRKITSGIAPIVAFFELKQPSIVTLDFLAEAMRNVGHKGEPRRVAEQLQRAGWLLSLRTRGPGSSRREPGRG